MTATNPIDHPTPEQVADDIARRCREVDGYDLTPFARTAFATALRNAAKVVEGPLLAAVQAHIGIFRSGSCITIGDMERLEAAMQASQRGAGAEPPSPQNR